MNAPILFMPVGQNRAVAELVTAILADGASASVVAPEGAGKTAVLDRLASELALSQVRIVRVACPATGGLSLPALLSQVIGRAKLGVLSDEDLELASDILTQADASCRRIVLLVDDAHGLLPPALRYIQLACRSGPMLRVVLAGGPGTLELLRGDEFACLRQSISRNIQLPPFSASRTELPVPRGEMPVALAPSATPSLPARRRNGSAWALAGLGVAASVALGFWLDRQDEAPAPLAASVAPEGVPALGRLAAPIDTPPRITLAEAPSATPAPLAPEVAVLAAPVEVSYSVLAEAEPATPGEAAVLQSRPAPASTAAGAELAQPTPGSAGMDAPPAPEQMTVLAVPGPAIEEVTPREAAALQAQPAPEPQATFVETAPPTPERVVSDALSALEQLAAIAEPIQAVEVATPREAAALQPSLEPPATVVELSAASPASPTASGATMSAPLDAEPAVADAAPAAEPFKPEPAITDAAPAQEPVVVGAAPAAEPATAVAETPATPSAADPPAITADLAAPSAPEPAVAGVMPPPSQPEAPAPVVASLSKPDGSFDTSPEAAGTEPAVALPPAPPIPVPAPALAVMAIPEAPRRVPKPARSGPERVATYDTRVDERRCRDIVLRAQLGEDIANADRQFLRAGCRSGR